MLEEQGGETTLLAWAVGTRPCLARAHCPYDSGDSDGAMLGASGDTHGRSVRPGDVGADKQRKGKGGGATSCGHGVRHDGGHFGSEALWREACGRKEDEGAPVTVGTGTRVAR